MVNANDMAAAGCGSPSRGRALAGVVALGFGIALIDGFDVQLLPMLVPTLAKNWNVPPSDFATPMAATLLGYAIGGVGLAPLSDRLGRSLLLSTCLAIVGLCVALTAAVTTTAILALLRVATGIGVGAALVTALAMIADVAPSTIRATLVTLALSAFTIGAAASGAIVSLLSPADWQLPFLVGGGAALLLLVGVWLAPPPNRASTARGLPAGPRLLLSRSWRGLTLPLWAFYLLVSFLMFFVTSWWPTILTALGAVPASAARLTALAPLGSLAGGFAAARAIDHGRFKLAMIALGILALVAFLGFPLLHTQPGGVAITTFLVGFSVGGLQFAVSTTAILAYPPLIRGAGAGWAGGIARIGSVCAPLAGGWLLVHVLPTRIVPLLALPVLIAVIPSLLLQRRLHPAKIPTATSRPL